MYKSRRELIVLLLILGGTNNVFSQSYDSITISHFLITNELLGRNWKDTLKAGHFSNYLSDEKVVWKKWLVPAPRAMGVTDPILSLTERIKNNGTEDVSKCFIPRHSINYYKKGEISRYLLICFECDGLRFSDDPVKTFVKDVRKRDNRCLK